MAISDGNGERRRSVLKSIESSLRVLGKVDLPNLPSCGDAVFTCREKVSLEDQPNAKANTEHH